MRYTIRPIVGADESFLWEMLYYAAHMDEDAGVSVQTAKTNPFLAKFVSEWGKPGDLGCLVYEPETNRPLGAAWLRLFVGEDKSCHEIDDNTPELAIAVIPEYIGKGVGAQLLSHLLETAKTRYPAVYLNVGTTNPTKRLYERFGFGVIGELTNRVGGNWHCCKGYFAPLVRTSNETSSPRAGEHL